MPLIIETGDLARQLFCKHPDTKQLLGFVQEVSVLGRWRVELFLTISGTASTQDEAIAFAQGAWAAIEAFGFRQKVAEVPTVTQRPSAADLAAAGRKRTFDDVTKKRRPDQGV